MPTHNLVKRRPPAAFGSVFDLAAPKPTIEPCLTPVQRRTLDSLTVDSSQTHGAFEKWILRYGVPLAAHAVILREAADLVAGQSDMGLRGARSGIRCDGFKERFAGEAPQESVDGAPHFFVCSLSALQESLYVPPCALPLFSEGKAGGVPGFRFFDADLLNLVLPMSGDGEGTSRLSSDFSFVRPTDSLERFLTPEAIQEGMRCVGDAWRGCVSVYVQEATEELSRGEAGPPVGASSLTQYFGEVVERSSEVVSSKLGAV